MKKKTTKKQLLNSFYTNITNIIIDRINQGADSWVKCWKDVASAGLPHNGTTNTPYKGINIFALWGSALEKGFQDSRWATYKQISAAGGQVQKGQKGTKVIFWKPLKIEEKQSDGTTKEKTIFTFRLYTVFNFEQCDGMKAPKKAAKPTETVLNDVAAAYLKREGLECKIGGNRAFYSPKKDYIKVPAKEQFKSGLHFDSTLFHEIAHSTGHPNRLNREGITNFNYFGSHSYSFEELVAELTAVFSMSKLGLMDETTETFENSTAYLAGWAEKLGNQPEWLNKAAREAFKAQEYIFKA